MFLPRLLSTLSLWTAVLVLASYGDVATAGASALDTRRPEGVLWIGAASALGFLAERLFRGRSSSPWSAQRLGLALLLTTPALFAWAHLEAYTSIRVLRQEIPPFLAPMYLAWAFSLPLILGRGAPRRDAATQALQLGLVTTALSGSLFLLPSSAALLICVPILLMQFGSPGPPTRVGPLGLSSLAFIALLGVATALAHTPLHAHPSFAWILSLGCLGAAIAVRHRDAAQIRGLIAALLVAPLLVLLADFALVWTLAQEVSWRAALDTRPTVFRQHPNFLAPFFATGAMLSLTLAAADSKLVRRAVWGVCCALLVAATWHTDSRAGLGALALGLTLFPTLFVLRLLARRLPIGRWLVVAGLSTVVGVSALFIAREHPALASVSENLERFETSVEYRADAWRNSVELIQRSPWFGIGPNTFISVARFEPGSRFFNEPTSPHPHNVFLYVAQAGGLGALLAFLAWLVLLSREMWSNMKRAADNSASLLALGLLATTLALLSANLLDLGLALKSVAPAPLFLLTGLTLAARAAPERVSAARVGPTLLACLALLVPWWTHGLRPLRAEMLVERAELRSFLAQGATDMESERARARDELRMAIELDPDNEQAHDLLARWLEQLPGGQAEAHDVLSKLVERAPEYAPAHSLLGNFFWRLGDLGQAAESLRRSVEGGHGSVFLRRDRARLVHALARLGRRTEAFDELTHNIKLEAAIIYSLDWRPARDSDDRIIIVEGGRQEPIRLVNAVQAVAQQHKQALERGELVGRRFWMDTVTAFKLAGRLDLALEFVDWLEANGDRIPFVREQLDSLANERALIALERGDLSAAVLHFRQAADLSVGGMGHPFYVTQLESVQRKLDAEAQGASAAEASPELDEASAIRAFLTTGEILDRPTALRDNLEARAAMRLEAQDPGGAAELLRRSLIYEDDLLARARIWERAGDLHRASGQLPEAEQAYLQALEHLTAKPYPLRLLTQGLAESIPARLARGLTEVWRAQGVRTEELLPRAWARVKHYSSTRQAMALWRLELHEESGRPDQLDRDAGMQLLDDPSHRPALFARMEAAEAMGELDEARQLMVRLTNDFAAAGDPDQQVQWLVESMSGRQDDPMAWREIALARLLQGRFGEAAGLFASARELADPSDTRLAARLLGWEARAALLAGDADTARALLERAVALDASRGILALRLHALGGGS